MYELRTANSWRAQVVEEVLGRFDDLPPQWEEISIEDFVEVFTNPVIPIFVDYRRVNNYPHIVVNLYIQRDCTGCAIVSDCQDQSMSFFKFDGVKVLKGLFDGLPIVSDTKWVFHTKTSIFVRKIEFSDELSPREVAILKMYILRDNCPGPVPSLNVIDNTYIFEVNKG